MATLHDECWLDLDRAASVEVTSEEKGWLISPPPKAAHHHRMLRSSPGDWLQRATARYHYLFSIPVQN